MTKVSQQEVRFIADFLDSFSTPADQVCQDGFLHFWGVSRLGNVDIKTKRQRFKRRIKLGKFEVPFVRLSTFIF